MRVTRVGVKAQRKGRAEDEGMWTGDGQLEKEKENRHPGSRRETTEKDDTTHHRRPQEPPRVDDRLEEDERFLHSILMISK